ncbi:MAG TPA: hypothetical protein VMZ00_14280 [Sporichthya sp.]|nr:hypothetical protein [Sporichthya sp.]
MTSAGSHWVRVRAAWSVSVVLALPVAFLLARHSGTDEPSPVRSQSDLVSSTLPSDEAAAGADAGTVQGLIALQETAPDDPASSESAAGDTAGG